MVFLSIIWKFDTCGKKGGLSGKKGRMICMSSLLFFNLSPQPFQWNFYPVQFEDDCTGTAQLARAPVLRPPWRTTADGKTGPHHPALSFAPSSRETSLRPSPDWNNPPAYRSAWIRWAASWKPGYTGWKMSAGFHPGEWQPDRAVEERRLT